MERANLRPDLLPTRAAGDASVRVREATAAGADLIIILGGDGTINEVVNGCPAVPLAVLPGGTANCLAVELGLGKNVERAAERLGTCVPRQVALGRISGGRKFLLMCGVGLDARIVHDVYLPCKRVAGKLAYWASGISQFTHALDPIEAVIDGQRYQGGFLLASRIRNYGGDLEIASGASLRKHDFEVVFFEGTNPLRYAWYMLGVGTGRVQKMAGVHVLHAKSIEIVSASHSQIDGEYTGRAPFKIDMAPETVTLLMPPAYG